MPWKLTNERLKCKCLSFMNICRLGERKENKIQKRATASPMARDFRSKILYLKYSPKFVVIAFRHCDDYHESSSRS